MASTWMPLCTQLLLPNCASSREISPDVNYFPYRSCFVNTEAMRPGFPHRSHRKSLV